MNDLVSIILPVYNQSDHITAIVAEYEAALVRIPQPHELLLVVNGSRDDSFGVCRRLSEQYPAVRAVHSKAGGWGLAVRLGIQEARGDLLCYTNSARTSPHDLTLCLLYGVVFPNAVVKANRKIRDSWLRRVGSLMYNLEVRAFFDLNTWDVNGTPKVFPRTFRKLLELTRDDDLIDSEFAAICRRENYPVVEVPIFSSRRHGGASTTGINSAMKMYYGAYRLWRTFPTRQSASDASRKRLPERIMHTDNGITLKLEHVACCVCGGHEGTVCLEGEDVEFRTCTNRFRFLECTTCGHVYLSPRPRLDEMPVIYRDYLTSNLSSAYYPSRTVAWVKDNLFDRVRLRPVLDRLKAGSHVLDIGAGAGRLLRLLRRVSKQSLRLIANDFAFDEPTRTTFAREDIGMLPGAIEFCNTAQTFDAITGIHVIEHVLDPPAVFRWAFAHLNPGGVLYLETPDYGTVLRRLFGNHWGHTHFPRHLNLFRKQHLARLATEAGFVIERHRNTTSAPAWNMSIRNALKMDALTKQRSVFEVFNYTNKFTLGFFTLLDLMLLALRVPTSTQQLVAVKPIRALPLAA